MVPTRDSRFAIRGRTLEPTINQAISANQGKTDVEKFDSFRGFVPFGIR